MTAPALPSGRARHRLAAMIVAALHEPDARTRLEILGRDARAAVEWLGSGEAHQAPAVLDRARQASAAVTVVPLSCPTRACRAGALATALDDAALLFDAELFFETHEILEPHWRTASGETREILQGLIQIAVGYQHRANGNAAGARALLRDGVLRIRGRTLRGLRLDEFASRVAATADRPDAISGADLIVPAFPRGWRESP